MIQMRAFLDMRKPGATDTKGNCTHKLLPSKEFGLQWRRNFQIYGSENRCIYNLAIGFELQRHLKCNQLGLQTCNLGSWRATASRHEIPRGFPTITARFQDVIRTNHRECSNDPWPWYFCKSIPTQMGAVSWYKLVVYILLSAKKGAILLQEYRDRNGRCIAILFKSIGVWGRLDSPENHARPTLSQHKCNSLGYCSLV